MNTPTGHLAATDPADTPFRQDTTPGLGLVGALLGVAFVVANGMLALGVQHFLYWTGGLAAVCFIPMIFCNLTGGTRRSRFWFDLLLTLTFFNFNLWAFS